MPRPSVHPELQAAAHKIPSFSFGPVSLRLIRLLSKLPRPSGLTPALLDAVEVRDLAVPATGDAPAIPLRVYRPKAATGPTPVLYWIHGGGYIIGDFSINDASCAGYARDLGLTVVSVDYRLAPDHPFPAPLEDCYAGLRWVKAEAGTLGVDSGRIAVGGSSAGAGLAAALAQWAHDRGEIAIALQLLIYPMLDDRTALSLEKDKVKRLVWSRGSNRFGWKSYLGRFYGARTMPEGAAAGRRADLRGLPPAWIGVGELDLFHDEDVAYAHRLREAGVDCELLVVPGAFHGFDLAGAVPIVEAFSASQRAALKAHLFPTG